MKTIFEIFSTTQSCVVGVSGKSMVASYWRGVSPPTIAMDFPGRKAGENLKNVTDPREIVKILRGERIIM
ncbi:MAG TPA: hypothetical protein DEA43_03900 [Candidatus Moranbacteria bacterium]|nr:hypothetical protein [Candidatus Moranbacteria bacterium]HBT45997.1 hypothetical protein [Candidatus Moranbacteria bacterium]